LWGINIESVWVMVTSILALIAIGFFAVWSLLSNVLAGVLLFFTGIIRIGDSIEILPDNIKGKVVKVGTLFTLLKDEESNVFSIPNNLLFQKYIKKIPNRPSKIT